MRFCPPVVACLLATSCASAARTIPFQGALRDHGRPAEGPVSATFRLYDPGGSVLWSETRTIVAAGGLFSVTLGDTQPIPDSISFSQALRLGVQAGSDPEMTPRVPLGIPPFSAQAGSLQLPWSASATVPAGASVLRAANLAADGYGITGTGYFGVMGLAQGTEQPPYIPPFSVGVLGSGPVGVLGMAAGGNIGVIGSSPHGSGVRGASEDGLGVYGMTTSGIAVKGSLSYIGQAVLGEATYAGSIGVLGTSAAGPAVVGRGPGADTDANPPAAGVTGNGTIGVRAHSASGTALDADAAGTGCAARIRNTGNGPAATLAGAGSAAVEVQSLGTGDVIHGADKSGAVRFSVSSAGEIRASGPVSPGGTDVTVYLAAAGSVAAGDVLAIGSDGKLGLSYAPYQTSVAGVCSGAPGLALGAPSGAAPVCVLGVAAVRVSAENGVIAPGDLLVASATAGCAMKATDTARISGALVGKALAPWPGPGTGVVSALISVR